MNVLLLKIFTFCIFEIVLCVCELNIMKKSENIGTLIILRNICTLVISSTLTKNRKIKSLRIFLIAFGFAVAQLACFLSVKYLSAIMFAICNQSRIISVYILSNTFVKKDFKFLQIFAISIIVISNIVPSLKPENERNFSFIHLIALIVGNFFNSCSQTYFSVIKDKIVDQHSYIFTVSFYQLILSLPFFFLTYKTVYLTITQAILTLCLALSALTFTKIGFSITSTQRVLIKIATSMSTTLVYMIFFEQRQNLTELICYFVVYFGIFVYHIPQIYP
ncbi:hypothetical protein M153_3250008583 [Pseudoloma neurophilia]|uniref:Uncharacterized protein n=1 Tax=Pseudoloma neurophilia TaxID=146866 RepID=A0A0R0M3S0_9MICR|nr:hypothetical protein M153_3250008583 [Pseudoloma neurophilia]